MHSTTFFLVPALFIHNTWYCKQCNVLKNIRDMVHRILVCYHAMYIFELAKYVYDTERHKYPQLSPLKTKKKLKI